MAEKRSAEENMRWNLRRRLNDKEYRAAVRDLRKVKRECYARVDAALDPRLVVIRTQVRAAILRRGGPNG